MPGIQGKRLGHGNRYYYNALLSLLKIPAQVSIELFLERSFGKVVCPEGMVVVGLGWQMGEGWWLDAALLLHPHPGFLGLPLYL